jgi:hypothetical protein
MRDMTPTSIIADLFTELDALHDRLYELEAAFEDADRDLAAADAPGDRDSLGALEWGLMAARPLAALRFGDSGR